MSKRQLGLVSIRFIGLALLPGMLAAQGEKLTLRNYPTPNQVIRIGMTQSMNFDVSAAAMPGGPMKVEGTTAFQASQRVGARDPQGRTTAEFSIDSMTIAMVMNGTAMSGPPSDSLLGKKFTIVYDSAGKVLDVTAPGEMGPAVSGLKGMLGQFGNSLPSTTLGVGDTVSVPVSMDLPIPGLNTGGQPLKLEGRSVYQLVAIGHDGGDRIASLKLQMTAALTGNINLQMTGGGTLELNVDKGFLKTGTNDLKMEMTMMMPTGGAMQMNGTIHMVMTGESRAP